MTVWRAASFNCNPPTFLLYDLSSLAVHLFLCVGELPLCCGQGRVSYIELALPARTCALYDPYVRVCRGRTYGPNALSQTP